MSRGVIKSGGNKGSDKGHIDEHNKGIEDVTMETVGISSERDEDTTMSSAITSNNVITAAVDESRPRRAP